MEGKCDVFSFVHMRLSLVLIANFALKNFFIVKDLKKKIATRNQNKMEEEIVFRKTQLINDDGNIVDVLLEVDHEICVIDENPDKKFLTKSKKLVQPYQEIIGMEGSSVNVKAQSQSSHQIIRGADYHAGWVQGYRMCLKDVREQKLRVRRNGPWGRILFKPGEGANATHSKSRKTCSPIPGKSSLVIDAVAQVLPIQSAPVSITQAIDEQFSPKVEVKKEENEEIILEMVQDSESRVRISQQTVELEDASLQVMECMDYPDSTIETSEDQ